MSVNSRKTAWLRTMAGALALGLLLMGLPVVVLYAHHGSLSLNCGLLPTTKDLFLDGSGKTVQTASWHLGDGTRTWGETYGIKINRAFVTLQISHLNPLRSPKAARENE
jgi:hypothetical protein